MDIQKYPIKVTLHKRGEMIYFSQLDMVRILERALRRAGLPIYFTQGFNPHVKLSFLNGLKLGVDGSLEVVLYFTQKIEPDSVRQKLIPQLPEGLDIIGCEVKN
jgi:radical SAM-linked protein